MDKKNLKDLMISYHYRNPFIQEEILGSGAFGTVHKKNLKDLIIPYHYRNAFIQEEILGSGAFGTVHKVKHRLDSRNYAIKIVKLESSTDFKEVVQEVHNLADLQHKNIISYKNSWLEYIETSSSSSSSSEEEKDSCPKPVAQCSTIGSNKSSSSSSDGIVFEAQSYHFSEDEIKENLKTSKTSSFSIKVEKIALYIQMEYCDIDLRNWLDQWANGSTLSYQRDIPSIFRDIVCGLIYIHKKNLIHRDLKPSNILYSAKDNMMKISDFGLATLHGQNNIENRRMSSNVGTKAYCAPELETGLYTTKVDIYSLGVILIELLWIFKTRKEFYETLNDIVEKNILPDKVSNSGADYITLIQKLVSKNPENRFSAQEILLNPPVNHCYNDHPLWEKCNSLEEKVENLSKENKELRTNVKILRQKNRKLSQDVDELYRQNDIYNQRLNQLELKLRTEQ